MGQLSSKLINVDRGKFNRLGIDQVRIDLIPIKSYSVQLENELKFISLRAQYDLLPHDTETRQSLGQLYA